MTDEELVTALRKRAHEADVRYHVTLERVAMQEDAYVLELALIDLRAAANTCNALAQLVHAEQFRMDQKAHQKATAS